MSPLPTSLTDRRDLTSAGQVERSEKRKLASSVWRTDFERHGSAWKCKHCTYTMPQKRAANAKRHLRLVHQLSEPYKADRLQKEQKPTEIEQLHRAIASREKEVRCSPCTYHGHPNQHILALL